MVDLLNRAGAANLWYSSISGGQAVAQPVHKTHHETILGFLDVTIPCFAFAGFDAADGCEPVFIGLGANGVAYFHLTSMSFASVGLEPQGASVPDSGSSYFKLTNGLDMAIHAGQTDISDGNPGCSPLVTDHGTVYPLAHTGYPVAAALPIGGGNYMAAKAGDAAALDVASCETALGSGSWVLASGSVNSIEIDIKSIS